VFCRRLSSVPDRFLLGFAPLLVRCIVVRYGCLMNRSAFHPSVTRNMLFRCCFRDYVALIYSEFSRLTVFGTVETALEIPAVIRSLRLQGFCLAQLCMVTLSQAHKTILQIVSSGHFIYLFAFLRIQLRAVALAHSSKTTSPIADMGGDSHLTRSESLSKASSHSPIPSAQFSRL
jgi:hypothetical protein